MGAYIFCKLTDTYKKVKAEPFIYNGFSLHIRKDTLYTGVKQKYFIVTENSSGTVFSNGITKKECLILLDLYFCFLSKKEIEKVIQKRKAQCFDVIKFKSK